MMFKGDQAIEGKDYHSRFMVVFCILLLLHFIAVCFLSMQHMTETVDEGSYYYFGLNSILGNSYKPDMQRMPISAINASFSYVLGDNNIGDDKSLFIARIPTVLAGALLGFYVMRWSRRLYGWSGALISLSLFVFCPNTIAHSRLITSDIYCTLFIFMTVFHLVSYLKNNTTYDYVLMVLACGLAVISKQTALLLGIILPMIVFIHWHRGNSIRVVLNFKKTLIAFCGVVFILNTAYGYNLFLFQFSWIPHFTLCEYIPIPQVFVDTFKLGIDYNKGTLPIYSYILGQYSQQGWWYYFPLIFALKVPIIFLMLLFFHVFLFKTCIKRNFIDEMTIITSVGILMLFFILACHVQLGIRYMLPIFPFLFLSAGKLGVFFQDKAITWVSSPLILCIILYAYSSMSFFPHFISYGNEFISNKVYLYRYFADSNLDWNQSGYYLNQYIVKSSHGNEKLYVNPEKPVNGTVIVNANDLLGIYLNKGKYAWLRNNFSPIDHVAYNWLVFKTTGVKEY